MKNTAIIGTGSYLPEKVLTNVDIEKFLDTSDEWIYTRTGIRERHVAAKDQATSDLAKVACERAMQSAGVTPDDIDLIVLATITPDTHCPAGANWLESKLKCTKAVSFDVTAACSGFIFALHVADRLHQERLEQDGARMRGRDHDQDGQLGREGEPHPVGRRGGSSGADRD